MAGTEHKAEHHAGEQASVHASQGPAAGPGNPALQRAGAAAVGRIAQESLDGATLFAGASRDVVLYKDDKATVSLPAGTQLSLNLSQSGIYVEAQPGIKVQAQIAAIPTGWHPGAMHIHGPEVSVTKLRYDFATARFDLDAAAKHDVAGLWGGIVRHALEQALEQKIRPRFPKNLQRPGYDMHHDPDLPGTVQAVYNAFDDDPTPNKAPQPSVLRNLQLKTYIAVSSPIRFPVSNGLEVNIPVGTKIELDATTVGQPPNARLSELRLTIPRDQRGKVEAGATGGGVASVVKTLDLHEIVVRRGGHFSFDYDLGPEQIAGGIGVVVDLFKALAHGQDPNQVQGKPTHMSELHKQVDAELLRQLPPQLRVALAKADGAIHGLGFSDIFKP